jgi:hypothetical protein
MSEDNENIPLDDSEQGHISRLEDAINNLTKRLEEIVDVQTQINNSQSGIAKSITSIRSVAISTAGDLDETKKSFGIALANIEKALGNVQLPQSAIDSIGKIVDSKIVTYIGQQSQSVEKNQNPQVVQQGYAGQSAMDVLGAIIDRLMNSKLGEAIAAKLSATSAPAVLADAQAKAMAQVADSMSWSYRIIKANKDLAEGKVDPDVYDKEIHAAIVRPTIKPPA